MFTNTLLNKEVIKIKVVDLDELYIFGIHHFFSWNHLVFQNLVRTYHFFKFKNLNCSNFVKWKEWLNQHSNLIGHDFRKILGKKSSHLELVWGRKTSYKFYPEIKKKNYSCSWWSSVISRFNMWLKLVTSFSLSY